MEILCFVRLSSAFNVTVFFFFFFPSLLSFFVVDFSLSLSPHCLLYISGYYADVKARCQVFRVCTNTDLSGRGSMNSLFIHIFIFIGFLSFRKQQHDKTTHNNIENSNKGAFASSISPEITAATKKNHFRFDMLAIRTLLINKKIYRTFFSLQDLHFYVPMAHFSIKRSLSVIGINMLTVLQVRIFMRKTLNST